MKNSTIPSDVRETLLDVLNNCSYQGQTEQAMENALCWVRSTGNPFDMDNEITTEMDPSQLAWLTLVSVEEDEFAPEMNWFDISEDD